MIIKAQIGLLTYRSNSAHVTDAHGLTIVIDENGKHGIYDGKAKAFAVEPVYDNIYEINPSLFAFSMHGVLSLWTIKESRKKGTDAKFAQREIRRITEFCMDSIEANSGILVMQGYEDGIKFFRIYNLAADWLSDALEWVGVISKDLILIRNNYEETLVTSSGKVLWKDTGEHMLIKTGYTIAGDERYPLIFDFEQERHLFPVFRKSRKRTVPEEHEIWKYVKSKNPPKWCEETGIFCPVHSGYVDTKDLMFGGSK